jgi:hypothetical protein
VISHPAINVLRYDAVVKALTEHPEWDFDEVARRTGVSAATVRKIYDGAITRPPVVVLERLKKPKRCPECRSLCSDWPCIVCELDRRQTEGRSEDNISFVYRHGPN